ncbi:MAG TPA: hypothetical protein VKD91_04755 [Pyrinomonadaceae bacterium]|nr:hypothetical protein [Pyrinomonadaceae bacterium]
MVTIQNMEVSFEVEGDGDEAAFAKLFNKYIKQWNRLEKDERERERLAEAERSLGDRHSRGVE